MVVRSTCRRILLAVAAAACLLIAGGRPERSAAQQAGVVTYRLEAVTSRMQVIEVPAGAAADVYFSVNLSGQLFLTIAAPPGAEACANFWWIKWPFGRVEQLGRHCGAATFDIPGAFSLSLASKLRVGGSSGPLKIGVTADEQVALRSTPISF